MKWLIFLLLFLPFATASSQTLNAGFVQGIWYSKTPFFAQETVRMYTAIQNNSGFDITGKVQFLDGEDIIGETSFSAVRGRLIEAWIDWEATSGTHILTAQITETVKIEVGKSPELIDIGFSVSGKQKIIVDLDTDKDGIGNAEDLDDDNDNLSDIEEKKIGTDPLNPDTDGDGIKDGEEIRLHTDPLSAENTVTEQLKEERPQQLEEIGLPEKIVKEYIPKIDSTIDAFFENVAKNLQEKKEELEKKIEQEKNPQPIFASTLQKLEEAININIAEEKTPTLDQINNFLLAGAVFALPQWRLVFLLFSLVVMAIIVKKYMWT